MCRHSLYKTYIQFTAQPYAVTVLKDIISIAIPGHGILCVKWQVSPPAASHASHLGMLE